MKNLLKMAFIAAAIFVASCGKSDDQTNNQTNNQTNIVFTTTEFSSVGYATENDTCTELGRNSGTYTVSGNTIFYKKQDGSSYSSEISLSGNKLTITQTKKDESDKEVTGTTVYIKR